MLRPMPRTAWKILPIASNGRLKDLGMKHFNVFPLISQPLSQEQ